MRNQKAWEHYYGLEQIVLAEADPDVLVDIEQWAVDIAQQARARITSKQVAERKNAPN